MLEGRRLGYRRQRGSRVPDSWLNFKWTLSNWRVRTSSWGIMAAELSLSKLSFRLLKNKCHLWLTSITNINTSERWQEENTLISCVPADIWGTPDACATLMHSWGNLLRSLLALPLAVDGWECCFGVKLQPFPQGLPDLLCVCQHTNKPMNLHHPAAPKTWNQSSFIIFRKCRWLSLLLWASERRHTFFWKPPWLRSNADRPAVLLIVWWATQIVPHTLGADPTQVRALCLYALVHSLLLRWAINICNHQH